MTSESEEWEEKQRTGRVKVRRERVTIIVFVFQAEDGIQYYDVTGVQTCALPIYPSSTAASIMRGRAPVGVANGSGRRASGLSVWSDRKSVV